MNTSEHPDTAPDTNTTTDADTDGHAEATREELWAYAGLRLHGTTRRHAWVTDSGTGQEKRFAVRRRESYAVGEVYRVTAEHRDGTLYLVGEPRYAADGRVDPDTAAEWRARHHAAETRAGLDRLQRNAARRNELDDALQPVRAIVQRLPSHADRSALIAYITRALLT